MTARSDRPSPSRSPEATPIPARTSPWPSRATPDSSPISSNRRSPWLANSQQGVPVVGDVDIGPIVARQLGDEDAQAPAFGQVDPGRRRDVGERPIAVVAIEPIGLGGEVLGAAVVARPSGAAQYGGDFASKSR